MSSALILAHGLGGRSDLPVPLWLAVYGAAAAVVVSFFALGAFWRTPRFEAGQHGVALPDWMQRLGRSRSIALLLRAAGVALYAATLVVLAFGSDSSASNPGPTWFYVWFWVGLVPASLLLGPVWRALNPLRTIATWAGAHRSGGVYPQKLGYWPAVVGLAAFVWLELVYDRADEPATVLGFIVVYSIVQVERARRYGIEWFDRGDAFEVYSTILARMSPWDRAHDGRIVLRNPFRSLVQIPQGEGLVAFIAVLLGSTAFDGLTRTTWWQSLSDAASARAAYLLLGTAGLAVAIGFVYVTYTAATAIDARLRPRSDREGLRMQFVHSLVPIAIGYTIAHYFSLLVFQGQAGYILASDPLDRGWNVFGTAQWSINYLAVSTQLIALVQVAAIVAGHVSGVVAAHDRAVGMFTGRDKVNAQYPLLAVMVIYTCGGIALLVGT